MDIHLPQVALRAGGWLLAEPARTPLAATAEYVAARTLLRCPHSLRVALEFARYHAKETRWHTPQVAFVQNRLRVCQNAAHTLALAALSFPKQVAAVDDRTIARMHAQVRGSGPRSAGSRGATQGLWDVGSNAVH